MYDLHLAVQQKKVMLNVIITFSILTCNGSSKFKKCYVLLLVNWSICPTHAPSLRKKKKKKAKWSRTQFPLRSAVTELAVMLLRLLIQLFLDPRIYSHHHFFFPFSYTQLLKGCPVSYCHRYRIFLSYILLDFCPELGYKICLSQEIVTDNLSFLLSAGIEGQRWQPFP